MEEKAPGSNNEIATVRDEEDLVMLVSNTTPDALDAEPHKQQVGEGVDDFGGVDGRIVILSHGTGISHCKCSF